MKLIKNTIMNKDELITELLHLSQELAKALTNGHYELIKKLIDLEGAVQKEQDKEEEMVNEMFEESQAQSKPDEVPPPKKGKTHKPKIEQPADVFSADDDLGLPSIPKKPIEFKLSDTEENSDLPF